jgi:uroporphyrinogen III methyltransferase/synthase
VIFLMSVANITKIVDSLLSAGWDGSTPIAAVEKGTRYDQRVVKGTLDDFLQVAEQAKLRTPAIFIVGRVVELEDKLGWFARQPKIYLPGTHPDKYRHLGVIVHRPLIKSVPLSDYSEADEVLKRLDGFGWLIFTSTNGVRFFFERLNALGLDSRALAGCKIAAIGGTTAQKLLENGIRVDLQPEAESSEGLVAEFARIGVTDAKMLLIRPKTARNVIIEGLTGAGADVEGVVVYENTEIEGDDVDFDYIDWILFTSGSTVRAYVNRYGPETPEGVKVYCLGQPTLDVARKNGIEAELLPS